MKKRPQTKAQARRNMIMYLKNVVGFRLDYFKGMSYDDMHLIFEAKFNSNIEFLIIIKEQLEEEKNRAIQSINEAPAQKVAKRRKLNEEVEDLKQHLEIVPDEDDDVYTEATSLARKVSVVDYEIIHLNNKPHYKIIRADGTHQLYLSFLTLLKNFDREDLESLWSLVKERFSTSKPNNFSDDFLLTTLRAMFERPDRQAQVWKSQRTVHGQVKEIPTLKVYIKSNVKCSKAESGRADSITSSFDPEIIALKAEMAKINKNLMKVIQINQQVKAVAYNYETCGGPHSYNDYPAIVGQTQNVYAGGAYNQGGELTLPVGKEAVTFYLDQTLRYSANYDAMSVNQIDLIDVACEEYSQEVLGFSQHINTQRIALRLLSATITLSNKAEDNINSFYKWYQSLVRSFDQEKNNIQAQQKKKMISLRKKKEGLNIKLTGFQTASKDLDSLLESQRLDKNKEGLGYSAVSPPPAQLYSPPKKDLSWTGLPEFADDTITDYSRPSPTIESNTDDTNRNSSVSETRESPSIITSKPAIKFVKAAERPTTDKVEIAKKPVVKYAELYRKSTKSQRHINNSQQSCDSCARMVPAAAKIKEAIPLDKGLFEEISGIDSSWGESIHEPLRSSKGVFPQFVDELTLDFEIDIASDLWFNHARWNSLKVEAFVASLIGCGGSDARIAE
nr:reverse transcriptase domain-containing protein [Tanacetum cinerariifolium]